MTCRRLRCDYCGQTHREAAYQHYGACDFCEVESYLNEWTSGEHRILICDECFNNEREAGNG